MESADAVVIGGGIVGCSVPTIRLTGRATPFKKDFPANCTLVMVPVELLPADDMNKINRTPHLITTVTAGATKGGSKARVAKLGSMAYMGVIQREQPSELLPLAAVDHTDPKPEYTPPSGRCPYCGTPVPSGCTPQWLSGTACETRTQPGGSEGWGHLQ